ncbi:MAG: glycosyl transferase family 4 [archaeon]
MNSLLTIPILASFFITLFLLPYWIRKAKQIGLVWDDMNKLKYEKVSGSGGIAVLVGFLMSVFIYLAYLSFIAKDISNIASILSIVLVIFLAASIGFLDDLFGWQQGGMSKRSRLLLLLFISLPVVVLNAGKDVVSLPFLGTLNLGLWYPLVLVPIGIIGATSTFNFLAGFNGLEAGQGILILSALSLVSYLTGTTWLAVLLLCMVFALIAFLVFNFYPTKVFPGDSLTYAVGAAIAVSAILGNFEKIAIFLFIPYIIEVILKSRGRLNKYSFGAPQKDGSLDLKYDKIYGLTHLSILILKKIGIKPTEKRAVYLIWLFQLAIIVLGFIIFREGIFIR